MDLQGSFLTIATPDRQRRKTDKKNSFTNLTPFPQAQQSRYGRAEQGIKQKGTDMT